MSAPAGHVVRKACAGSTGAFAVGLVPLRARFPSSISAAALARGTGLAAGRLANRSALAAALLLRAAAFFRALAAAARFLAALVLLVDRAPGAFLGLSLGDAAFLVAFLDVFGLALL